MDGGDNLRNGRHSDDVRPDSAQETVFGAGFEVRPGDRDVNALLNEDAVFDGDLARFFDQFLRIRFAHVRETRADSVVVRADERVATEEVDMVFDQHHVAALELRVQAAASVRNDEKGRAERLHHANRENDLLRAVTFVIMEAALHRDDRFPFERSENQLPGVRFDRRAREIRKFFVRNNDVRNDRVGETAEPGAQDDSDFRFFRPTGANRRDRLLNFVVFGLHCVGFLSSRRRT